MKLHAWLWFFSIGVGIFMPPPAHAADGSAGRFGLSLIGGYNTYAMEDVNRAIRLINDMIGESGLAMDEVNGGPHFGVGLRYAVSPRVVLWADYQRLRGRTEVGDYSGRIELDLPANAFLGSVAIYNSPFAVGRTRAGLGAGVGYYVSGVTETDAVTGVGYGTSEWKGSALGVHAFLGVEHAASESVSFEGLIGYRHAKLEPEIDGVKLGGDVDWSGVMGQVGVVLYIPVER